LSSTWQVPNGMPELAGLRAIVVEDEGSIALLIEDMLTDLGCEIVASAARLSEACRIAESSEFDFAVLDLNLDGQPALPVAEILTRRGIPFVFSTGYGCDGVPKEFARCQVIAKPFSFQNLRDKVAAAIDLGRKVKMP
jgi:CheY-like chemotaxis protein